MLRPHDDIYGMFPGGMQSRVPGGVPPSSPVGPWVGPPVTAFPGVSPAVPGGGGVPGAGGVPGSSPSLPAGGRASGFRAPGMELGGVAQRCDGGLGTSPCPGASGLGRTLQGEEELALGHASNRRVLSPQRVGRLAASSGELQFGPPTGVEPPTGPHPPHWPWGEVYEPPGQQGPLLPPAPLAEAPVVGPVPVPCRRIVSYRREIDYEWRIRVLHVWVEAGAVTTTPVPAPGRVPADIPLPIPPGTVEWRFCSRAIDHGFGWWYEIETVVFEPPHGCPMPRENRSLIGDGFPVERVHDANCIRLGFGVEGEPIPEKFVYWWKSEEAHAVEQNTPKDGEGLPLKVRSEGQYIDGRPPPPARSSPLPDGGRRRDLAPGMHRPRAGG